MRPDNLLSATDGFDIISRYHCIARFNLDSTLQAANERFLSVFEYDADEVIGRHHRMFLLNPQRIDERYINMWSGFRDGVARSGEVLRRSKSGAVIWLQAVYCPIFDHHDDVTSVLKVAILKTADLVDHGVDVPLNKLAQ